MQDKIHPNQVPKNWPFPTYKGKQIEVQKVNKTLVKDYSSNSSDLNEFEVALF